MTVEERLVKLERENRRLKCAVLLILMVVASVFVMGQSRTVDQVRTHELLIVDDRDFVVASLGHTYTIRPDGSQETVGGILSIYPGPGKQGAINLHYYDGPAIVLADGTGGWIELGMHPDGGRVVTKSGGDTQIWP